MLRQTVIPATRNKYLSKLDAFFEWAAANNETASDHKGLDDVLVQYIHDLYEDERGHSVAAATLSAIKWCFPELKFALPRASQASRGWSKMCPPTSYPPLTWELAVTIAVQLSRGGRRREAVGVLLSFDCMLRVGELVSLRREDVADSADAAEHRMEHKGMVLRLRKTKTGNNKSVDVMDPSVVALVRELVRDTEPGQLLFPVTTASYRRSFKRVCSSLGLSPLYVPHSCRHGGATRLYHVMRWPMEDIMTRGRWASTKSARLYIQSSVALLLSMTIPPAVGALAVKFAKDPMKFISIARAS